MDGLRERKRLESRRAMERAAVELAYAEGVGAVTVGRVCEAAGVSRSTFFNYFWSIEQAVFGTTLDYDPAVTERILAEHADDLVLAASLIAIAHVRGDDGDAVARRRFALYVREPATTAAVSAGSRASREALADVLERWLDAHPERARLAGTHGAEARLAVALSIALCEEALPHLGEVDGDIPLDLDVLRAARARMAAVTAVAG